MKSLGKFALYAARMINKFLPKHNPPKNRLFWVLGCLLLLPHNAVNAADILPPKGVLVRDGNGEPFLVSGSGKIIQKNYTYGSHTMINSVDYEMELGAPVMAAFPGVISRVDSDSKHGAFVVVKGDNGIAGRYYHLTEADIENMSKRVGQRISMGEVIGRVGKTGNTVGNHYGLELGYEDQHNIKNNYFSTAYEHRAYYDTIINKLFSGQYNEWKAAQERSANEERIKNNERRMTK